MDKDKVKLLLGGNKQNTMAESIRNMKEEMADYLELQSIVAILTRQRYNALIKEGFTEAEALELSKNVTSY